MSQKIANLPLPFIIKEIENVLREYPEYPYQVTLSIQESRQRLIDEVLGQISNQYVVVEEGLDPSKNSKLLSHSLEERVRIESLIRERVFHILQEKTDWASYPDSQRHNAVTSEDNLHNEPSHWFG